MTLETKEYPKEPIFIIEHVAGIIEQLSPEVLACLGSIATMYADDQATDYVESVADAADRAQRALAVIFDAINEVSCNPIVAVEDVSEATEETEKTSEAIITTDPVDHEDETAVEKIPKTIAKIMQFLKDKDEQVNIREIQAEIFGSPRLKRNEEKALMEALDLLVAHGLMTKGGKRYGFNKTLEDAAYAFEHVTETEKWERELVEYIAKLQEETQDRINVGQLVRGFYEVENLPKDGFNNFVVNLDRLARSGYVKHLGGSWYALGDVSLPPSLDDIRRIQLPAMPIAHHQKDEPTMRRQSTQAKEKTKESTQAEQTISPSRVIQLAELEQVRDTLNTREQKILAAIIDSVPANIWFARGNINFDGVDFPSDSARNQVFAKLTGTLSQVGFLETNGKQRGARRYNRPEIVSLKNEREGDDPEPIVTAEHVEPDLANVLSEREQQILDALIRSIKPGDWFSLKNIDLDGIDFQSKIALSQAFSIFARKLFEAGFLESNGKQRGGRKYRIVSATGSFSDKKQTDPTDDEPTELKDTASLPKQDSRADDPQFSQPKARRSEIHEARRLLNFSQGISDFISDRLQKRRGKVKTLKLVDLTKSIAKELSIEAEEAREIIGEYVEQGSFHYHSKGGSRYISLTPQEKTSNGNGGQSKSIEKKKQHIQLKEEDVITAQMVYGQLLQLQHVQQGIEIKILARDLGFDDGKLNQAFRQSLRRLENNNLIIIEAKSNPSTRSPHSRRIQIPLVKLVSQEFKDRLKSDPKAVYEEIRQLNKRSRVSS